MVINNWRACHSYPLQAIKMTLLTRAKQIHSEALIAQRLKRLPSIAIKLKDNPNMHLSADLFGFAHNTRRQHGTNSRESFGSLSD